MFHSKLKPLIADAEVALYQLSEAMSKKVEEALNAHDGDIDWFDEPTPLVVDLQELLDLHDEFAGRLDEANEAVKEVYELAEMLEKLNSIFD